MGQTSTIHDRAQVTPTYCYLIQTKGTQDKRGELDKFWAIQ